MGAGGYDAGPDGAPMPRVFISHSSVDRVFIETVLIPGLKGMGMDPWYSTDNIPAGSEWSRHIKEALDQSAWVLVVLSPDAEASDYVKSEVSLAMGGKKGTLIPILFRTCAPTAIDMRLALIEYVDFRTDTVKAMRKLAHRLSQSCTPEPGASLPLTAASPESVKPAAVTRFIELRAGTAVAQPSGDLPPLSELEGQGESALLARLVRSVATPVTAWLPLAFWCLTCGKRAPAVPAAAEQYLLRLSPTDLASALVACAKEGRPQAVGMLLDGFGAMPPDPAIVRSLERFLTQLGGTEKRRGLEILERKRVGLVKEEIVPVLRRVEPRLEVSHALGRGLLTSSLQASDRQTRTEVVVRLLRTEFAAQPTVRDAYLVNAQRSARVAHPGLVVTRWVGDFLEDGLCYAVRDHVDGMTLKDAVDREGRWSSTQVLEVLRQSLAVLAESTLYEHLPVHGGIRPSNLFVTRSSRRIVLGDTAPLLPTVAPELPMRAQDFSYVPADAFGASGRDGSVHLDPGYDLYGLGCIAYELLAGAPPVEGAGPFTIYHRLVAGEVRPLAEAAPGTPVELLDLVARLTGFHGRERLLDPAEALRVARQLTLGRKPGASTSGAQLVSSTLLGRHEAQMTNWSLSLPPSFGDLLAERDVTAPVPKVVAAPPLVPRPTSPAPTGPNGQDLLSGAALGHRYVVRSILGKGGMATAYLGTDVVLDRPVVIKVPHARLLEEPGFRERFAKEVRSLLHLEHPNVLRVMDAGEDTGSPYVVVQHMSGGSLRDRLEEMGGLMSPRDVCEWLLPIAKALDYVHAQRILHRDVKPGNILFDAHGTPHLADFGIAKGTETDTSISMTQTGAVLGSPEYMAPEAMTGALASAAYDQYSLGVVVYEAVSGHRPFEGDDNFTQVLFRKATMEPPLFAIHMAGLPAAAAAAVRRALLRDPSDRFMSCSDFATAFANALGTGELRPAVSPEAPSTQPPFAASRAAHEPRAAPQPASRWWWPFRRRTGR